MKQIICLGSACKDIFFPTSEGVIMETPEDLLSQKKIAFELGAKYKIEERHESLGGCAANVAVGLSKLGIDTGCYAIIGNDYIGDWILEELEDGGVDTSNVSREKDCVSDISAIIIDSKSAERVIFSNQKANGRLVIDPEKISDAEWFFIGDLHGDWEDHLDNIFNVADDKGIRIAFNPRQVNIHDNATKIVEKIAGTEVLFLNKDESMEIISATGKYDDEDLDREAFLLEKLSGLGAKTVVITDGTRGAWVLGDDGIFHVMAQKVPAVDSTGAGDSFASGFLAAYIGGKNIGECLKWGIANSSSEVCSYGSIYGLLDEDDILEKIMDIKIE